MKVRHAINTIERLGIGYEGDSNLRMAVETILNYAKAQLSLEETIRDTTSDTIYRQQTINRLKRKLTEPQYQHAGEDWYVGIHYAISEIEYMPPVYPQHQYTIEGFM